MSGLIMVDAAVSDAASVEEARAIAARYAEGKLKPGDTVSTPGRTWEVERIEDDHGDVRIVVKVRAAEAG